MNTLGVCDHSPEEMALSTAEQNETRTTITTTAMLSLPLAPLLFSQQRICGFFFPPPTTRSFFHNAYTILFSADYMRLFFSADDTLFFSQRRIYVFSCTSTHSPLTATASKPRSKRQAPASPGRRGHQAEVEEASARKPRSKRQAPASRGRRG